MPRTSTLLLVLALLTSASCHSTPTNRTTADLLLVGGRIFTADPARPWAEAVAIHGDRILAVGTSKEIHALAGPATRIWDLDGRVVIPGINDAHVHEPNPWDPVSVAPAASDEPFASVLARVAARARELPAGTWIVMPLSLPMLDDPDANRASIDAAIPDHPVWVQDRPGHVALLNSRGLAAANIAEDVADFPGGWYQRDPSGRLDGWIYEYARWRAMRRIAEGLPDAASIESWRAFGRAAVAKGITSVQAMPIYVDTERALATLHAAALPLRVRLIDFATDAHYPDPTSGCRAEALDDLVRVCGVKRILDGTPVERGAALRAPYADRSAWHGRLDGSAEALRAELVRVRDHRIPALFHCSGDAAVAALVTAMVSIAPLASWRPLRIRIEHGDGISGELADRVREAGIVVVQNPSHLMNVALMRKRLGPDRARWFPVRSLHASGVSVAFGSDGPLDPFLNMRFAASHLYQPSEAVDVQTSVALYTRASAYAEGAEAIKGTIAPGLLADVAVLSQDIFTVPVDALPATRSMLTIIGGRVALDDLR